MRRLAVLVALLALLAPAAALAAAPRANLADVEDEVMCVSCNVVLNVAESPQAEAVKSEIRGLIADGYDKQQIKDQLVKEYGPRVLALPKAEGFNLTAYIVPILVALGLVALVVYLVIRWSSGRRDQDDDQGLDERQAGPVTDEEARRLDDELARFDTSV